MAHEERTHGDFARVHAERAREIVAKASAEDGFRDPEIATLAVACAQVHATLALAAATREQTNVLAGIALDRERLSREHFDGIVKAIEGRR